MAGVCSDLALPSVAVPNAPKSQLLGEVSFCRALPCTTVPTLQTLGAGIFEFLWPIDVLILDVHVPPLPPLQMLLT